MSTQHRTLGVSVYEVLLEMHGYTALIIRGKPEHPDRLLCWLDGQIVARADIGAKLTKKTILRRICKLAGQGMPFTSVQLYEVMQRGE